MTKEMQQFNRHIIREAIERIETAEKIHVEMEADATKSAEERRMAMQAFRACEAEFAWQWRNGKRMMDKEPN